MLVDESCTWFNATSTVFLLKNQDYFSSTGVKVLFACHLDVKIPPHNVQITSVDVSIDALFLAMSRKLLRTCGTISPVLILGYVTGLFAEIRNNVTNIEWGIHEVNV